MWSRGTPGACLCGREAVPTAPLRQGPLQSALGGGGPSPEDPGPWARLDGQATPDGGIHRQLSALQPGQGRGSRDTVGACGRRPQGPAWPGSVGGRSWASGPTLGVPGLLLASLGVKVVLAGRLPLVAGNAGVAQSQPQAGGLPSRTWSAPPRAVVLAREEDRRRVRWCLRTPAGKPAPRVLVPSPPPVPVTPDLQAPSPSRSWWWGASFPPPLPQGAGQWVPGGEAGSLAAGCWYGRGCQPAGPREPPTPAGTDPGPTVCRPGLSRAPPSLPCHTPRAWGPPGQRVPGKRGAGGGTGVGSQPSLGQAPLPAAAIRRPC